MLFQLKDSAPRKAQSSVSQGGQVSECAPFGDYCCHDFIEQIPHFAERHCKMASDIFGIEFDYSAASIERIDEVIVRGWNTPPIRLDAVVLPLGCYLGETIRKLHGARWEFASSQGYYLDFVGGHDLQVFPFHSVKDRFCNGERAAIRLCYADMMRSLQVAPVAVA